MKTYTKQDFHNPEQLTRQQVGEEYRLLLNKELPSARGFFDKIQLILDDDWVIANGDSITVSYRVPLATPLPDGTVLSSNECCWSDDVYADVKAAHAAGKKIEWRPTSESIWRDDEAEVPAWEGYGFEFRIKQEQKKTHIYVAGPMSNMPDYNFTAFYAAAESLEKQGYEPVNPAQMDLDSGWTLEEIKDLDVAQFQEFLKGAAKRDLDALQQCDAIALLPGWENSKGARAEKAVAEWLGLDVTYLGGKQENCEYCQGSCQGSTPSGCVGAEGVGAFGNLGPCSACIGYDGTDGESGPVDILSEKAPQISDEKQTMDNPLPDPEVKVLNLNMPKYAFKDGEYKVVEETLDTSRYAHGAVKQPYNSDERAEWDVSGLIPKIQSSIAPDDPKGAAGAKKPPMHLLPPNALIETAKAMGHGAAKYGAWNFIETTVCASTYVGAIGRHWAAYARSEDIDPDSGLPHLALIAANCFVLLTAQKQGTLRDDRPKLRQI